jgi:ribose 1,5-bisphosphate isomerase
MAKGSVDKIVNDIKALKIQGAREVAKAGVKAMCIASDTSKAKDRKSYISGLRKTAEKLVRARATEPALQHVVASILIGAEKQKAKDIKTAKKAVSNVCSHWLADIEAMLDSIAHYGASLIKNGDILLTHCHSHAVMAVFKLARAQRKRFSVIVTETRPLFQGVKTAKELLSMRVPVTYCTDSAAGIMMKSANKVIVGCDALLPDGSLINKIGTFPIALLACKMGKPFYVAGELIKFTRDIMIEERDPKEVMAPGRLKGAKIVNPAFDVTPAELIKSIITEKGVLRPDMISSMVTLKRK